MDEEKPHHDNETQKDVGDRMEDNANDEDEVMSHFSFKQRLWEYLVRNVYSAVDELYCMCELESIPSRCEDAARVLQACRDDFIKLLELIQMQTKSSTQKSLAWEVKKGSNADKPTVAKALEHMAKVYPRAAHKASHHHHRRGSVSSTGSDSRPKPKAPIMSALLCRHISRPHRRPAASPTYQPKLSLPRKPKRSPSETKLLSEQRLDTVTANKHAIESARLSRIRLAAERMEHVTSRNASSRQKQEQLMWAKLDRADRLKAAHLRCIVSKAGSENTKVDEINFIQHMIYQDRKIELQQRLEHVASRRETVLDEIKKKASLKAESIRAAAAAKEASLTQKIDAIQRRHEGVQARRLSYQQAKKPRRARRSHPREKMAQHLLSLETRMARTMNKNAQRLRERLKAHTRHATSAPAPPHPPRLAAQLDALLQSVASAPPADVERPVRALARFLQATPHADVASHVVRQLQGLPLLVRTLTQAQRGGHTDAMAAVLRVLLQLGGGANAEALVAENLAVPLVDALRWVLTAADATAVLPWAFPAAALPLATPSSPKMDMVRQDLIRYMVNSGLLFRVVEKLGATPTPAEGDDAFRLLVACVHFLAALTTTCTKTLVLVVADLRLPLVKILKSTGLAGVVAALLNWFPLPLFHDCHDAPLGPGDVAFATLVLHVLNNIARLDLVWFQATLGSPLHQPTFLQLAASVLHKHRADRGLDELVLQLVALLGRYALCHPAHQETLRWGHVSVLERLATLPFAFFCDPRYKDVLLPTLIAICDGDDENRRILANDVSCLVLVVYLRKLKALQQAMEGNAWPSGTVQTQAWFHVAERLPVELWDQAIAFLEAAE
ncbi:S phase cyclin A-associated protein in the endoplasmic reticulum [Achlya hypogyna]|uniref:S phase cyclin A-associated protein in the endoplasmic reticulum n=1 Tax=Achlya hypogyna TaxID=1202772 RepID=A0A1V9Z5W5_ACHHY|nr:S phase cyclin A-associated protein in the endoplasmic reticulum [Achlya hypogyna]